VGNYPLGVAPAYVSVASAINAKPGAFYTEPYSSASMRIVSLIARIKYTGPVNTCAGVLRVTDHSANISNPYTTTSAVTTSGLSLSTYSNTGTSAFVAPSGTVVYAYDTADPLGKYDQTTKTYRPEQGVIVRSAHRGTEFQAIPTTSVLGGLSQGNQTGATSAISSYYSIYGQNWWGGVLGFDNNWSTPAVCFENVNSDASYSVETMACVEIQPTAGSILEVATKDSVKTNLLAIQDVERMVSKEGASTPMAI
jgi:hypothetical protein